jgi:NDP-mannose synthase
VQPTQIGLDSSRRPLYISRPGRGKPQLAMEKRAVILVGGHGTRLRPYTITFPKPLMPIGETPILEIVLKQLVACGFQRITLAVSHQAALIRTFFGDGSKWGALVDYSLEAEPLGTMGPLHLIPDLPDNVLVMNGDVLTDVDYAEFFDWHRRQGTVLSICATEREQPVDFGVLTANTEDELIGFQEKPTLRYLVSTGIYGVNRRALKWIPRDKAFGFDELVLRLLAARERITIQRHKGYWLDIGRPDDFERAVHDFTARESRFFH